MGNFVLLQVVMIILLRLPLTFDQLLYPQPFALLLGAHTKATHPKAPNPNLNHVNNS